MDEKECGHFFANPFQTNKNINTDSQADQAEELDTDESQHFNQETSSHKFAGNQLQSVNALLNRKFKIDPFANPKVKLTNSRIIRNLNPDVRSKDKYYETVDNQALAVIKDYKSYLHLNNNAIFNSATSKDSHVATPRKQRSELDDILIHREVTKEKLKKQINTNEMTLARMKLDLFIL